MKNLTVNETFSKTQPMVEAKAIPAATVTEVKHVNGSFNVQTNRITEETQATMKIKGMYKIRLQNKGQVAIKVFGNFDLPSYADEVFESGDSLLGFSTDAQIVYAPHSSVDAINVVITGYTRTS